MARNQRNLERGGVGSEEGGEERMVRGEALRTVCPSMRVRRCLFHKEFLDQKSHREDGTVADQHRRLAKARRMICRRVREGHLFTFVESRRSAGKLGNIARWGHGGRPGSRCDTAPASTGTNSTPQPNATAPRLTHHRTHIVAYNTRNPSESLPRGWHSGLLRRAMAC